MAVSPQVTNERAQRAYWIQTPASRFWGTPTGRSHLSWHLECFMDKAYRSWVGAHTLKRIWSLQIGHSSVTCIPQDSRELGWCLEWDIGGDCCCNDECVATVCSHIFPLKYWRCGILLAAHSFSSSQRSPPIQQSWSWLPFTLVLWDTNYRGMFGFRVPELFQSETAGAENLYDRRTYWRYWLSIFMLVKIGLYAPLAGRARGTRDRSLHNKFHYDL